MAVTSSKPHIGALQSTWGRGAFPLRAPGVAAVGLFYLLGMALTASAQTDDRALRVSDAAGPVPAAHDAVFSEPENAATAEAQFFHCDGTDPALFQEIQESGWIGYGETWDLHTCDQGAQAFVSKMNRRWRAWRTQRVREKRQAEMSFYAAFFPFVAFGGIGSMFGVAWILAVVQRRRRTPRQYLYCTDCDISLPVAADDPVLRNAFCPACGHGCELLAHDPAAADPQVTLG